MRRLPRSIDKPTELLGFRMDEIGVFVSVLLVFLLVDWFFVGIFTCWARPYFSSRHKARNIGAFSSCLPDGNTIG